MIQSKIWKITGIALGIILIIFVGTKMFDSEKSETSLEKVIHQIKKQEQHTIPQKIAKNITVTALEITKNSMTYINQISGKIDPEEFKNKDALQSVKKKIANKLCRDKQFYYVLSHGGVVAYQYQTEEGVSLLSIDIRSRDCN